MCTNGGNVCENARCSSPGPVCTAQGDCSSMVRSLAFSRFFAAFSLAAFLTLSSVSSRAQEISTEPEQTQISRIALNSASSANATPDPADLEVSWRKMPARFLHETPWKRCCSWDGCEGTDGKRGRESFAAGRGKDSRPLFGSGEKTPDPFSPPTRPP